MRHRKEKKILDRKTGPRKALLRSLILNLLLHEKIKTTLVKAKTIRPIVESLITVGKESNLSNRRKINKFLANRELTKKILEEISPRYKERPGGYTRIVKIGPRRGDGAEIALIEFV